MNAKYHEKYMIRQIHITFSFLFQMFDRVSPYSQKNNFPQILHIYKFGLLLKTYASNVERKLSGTKKVE